jgi:hypothetical protein
MKVSDKAIKPDALPNIFIFYQVHGRSIYLSENFIGSILVKH